MQVKDAQGRSLSTACQHTAINSITACSKSPDMPMLSSTSVGLSPRSVQILSRQADKHWQGHRTGQSAWQSLIWKCNSQGLWQPARLTLKFSGVQV